MRHPGIEPGPSRWQRDIITTRLMTLDSWEPKETRGLQRPVLDGTASELQSFH